MENSEFMDKEEKDNDVECTSKSDEMTLARRNQLRRQHGIFRIHRDWCPYSVGDSDEDDVELDSEDDEGTLVPDGSQILVVSELEAGGDSDEENDQHEVGLANLMAEQELIPESEGAADEPSGSSQADEGTLIPDGSSILVVSELEADSDSNSDDEEYNQYVVGLANATADKESIPETGGAADKPCGSNQVQTASAADKTLPDLVPQWWVEGPPEWIKKYGRKPKDSFLPGETSFEWVQKTMADIMTPPYKAVFNRSKPNPLVGITVMSMYMADEDEAPDVIGEYYTQKMARGAPNSTSRGGGYQAFHFGRGNTEGSIRDQRSIEFPGSRTPRQRRRTVYAEQKRQCDFSGIPRKEKPQKPGHVKYTFLFNAHPPAQPASAQ